MKHPRTSRRVYLLLSFMRSRILLFIIGSSALTVAKSLLPKGALQPLKKSLPKSKSIAMSVVDSSTSGSSSDDDRGKLVFSLVEYLKNDKNAPRLILASQSPRRREILDLMGLTGLYDVEPSPCDETKLQEELRGYPPEEYTRRLAEAKAAACINTKSGTKDFFVVLGSDTVVELDGKILEKPKDKLEAKEMVKRLSGRSHHVHTGVAIYQMKGGELSLCESFTDTASVTFASIGAKDIDAYVDSKEGLDKAGAYGIQGIGGQLVSSIEGDFFTVMGLPMHKTSAALCNAMQS